MIPTIAFNDIDSIIECSTRAGQHFFDTDTLEFFDSVIHDEVFHGEIFITSELNFQSTTRFWTVRVMDDRTGKVSTLGEFQQFDSLDRARKAVIDVQNCDMCGVWVLPDDGVLINVEPARHSMDDPYPGSSDIACDECAEVEK